MSCDLVKVAEDSGIRAGLFGGSGVAVSQGVNWLGYSVFSVGTLHSLAFGGIMGVISGIASHLLGKLEVFKNVWINAAAGTAIGAAVAYGASFGAAALGFVASPISIPTALIITVASYGAWILLHLLKKLICSNSAPQPNQSHPQNQPPATPPHHPQPAVS